MTIHVVASGDTVSSIARDYAVPLDTIIYNNQLVFPYNLAVGQALLISTMDESVPTQEVVTNGYAYPFIDREVLNRTLPYLTRLSVLSYGFTTEGYLIPPILSDEPLIAAAFANGTDPFLTLTPFDENGRFNNNLITQLVNREDAIARLIEELQVTVTEKGYQGVDIDFE